MGIPTVDTRYLFFTGKGGVGKTSLSCATGIALADAGRRVLIVSTDPASNLDEVLGVKLSGTPTTIPEVSGLFALNIGTVQASELIRTLLKSERPSSLARAIIEAGRINKTVYLLNYIDDEDYRRRILTQLNRGEGRHAVARAICHGQRGEIRKRYREGQEDQLGALGLVTNTVVLWNTLYMQAALEHLQQHQEIRGEDESRLSPLAHGHVNVLGDYSFTLAEQVMKGQLRPLNQPTENIDGP